MLIKLKLKELVQFHCYDYIETVWMPYGYRMNQLACSDMYSYCVKYVETTLVNSKDAANIKTSV